MEIKLPLPQFCYDQLKEESSNMYVYDQLFKSSSFGRSSNMKDFCLFACLGFQNILKYINGTVFEVTKERIH